MIWPVSYSDLNPTEHILNSNYNLPFPFQNHLEVENNNPVEGDGVIDE